MNNLFVRIGFFIIATYFFFSGLYYLKGVIIPLLFGAFFAMLLLPVAKKLEIRMGDGLAVSICVFIVLIINFLFLLLFYFQLKQLVIDMPIFKREAMEKFRFLQFYVEKSFGIPIENQLSWLDKNYSEGVEFMNRAAKNIFVNFTSSLITFFLAVIYMFFMLLLRYRIKRFFLLLFHIDKHEHVLEIISRVKVLVLHYIKGLGIATLIIAVLNIAGLITLGIKHAIFWGFVAALLNLIPYVGSIFAMIFPVLMALVYKDSFWYVIAVILLIQITHFFYAKILTPKIVGAHIQINPLATLVVIIAGGALWGLSGMILFLPLLGIFKIICDAVIELRPVGYLIGDSNPS